MGTVVPPRVGARWTLFRGICLEAWGHLAHDTKAVRRGRQDKLAGRLQELFEFQASEAQRFADRLLRSREAEDRADAEVNGEKPRSPP